VASGLESLQKEKGGKKRCPSLLEREEGKVPHRSLAQEESFSTPISISRKDLGHWEEERGRKVVKQ